MAMNAGGHQAVRRSFSKETEQTAKADKIFLDADQHKTKSGKTNDQSCDKNAGGDLKKFDRWYRYLEIEQENQEYKSKHRVKDPVILKILTQQPAQICFHRYTCQYA